MTSKTRPLYHEILQVLRKANVPYDPLLPAQIKTVTATNRLDTDTSAFIGMHILPGRINVLIRPKTFVVETTRIDRQAFITTYSVVVMDAAGDLRPVEGLTVDHTDLDRLAHFVEQVADLVEEQNDYNHHPPTTVHVTRSLLSDAATRISHIAAPKWVEWIIYILEVLQDHADPVAYGKMLAELSLAIEVWELEGRW